MALCLAAGALTATLAAQSFTLAWTHSIEKIRWEEDWQIVAAEQTGMATTTPLHERRRASSLTLRLVEARVRGAGAGMEPPAGAVLSDGVWHYHPARAPLEELVLAHSPYAAAHELCIDGRCRPLDHWLAGLPGTATVSLRPCQSWP